MPFSDAMSMQKRQENQHLHDVRNHFDIVSLSRIDRLKHYGLHYAKYAGRFARGSKEIKSRTDTIVDAFLVVLSAANALNQALPNLDIEHLPYLDDWAFVERAGRFADACEKIDHLEEFRDIAIRANSDLFEWLLSYSKHEKLDIDSLVEIRCKNLASRVVYTAG